MQTNPLLRIIFCALCANLIFFSSSVEARPFFGRTLLLPTQQVAPGDGKLLLNFVLPEHHEFVEDAPSTFWIRTKHPTIFKTSQTKHESLHLAQLPHSIAYTANPGETIVVIDFRILYCDKESKVCLSDSIRLKFPIQIEAAASSQLSLRVPLKSKTSR